VRPPESRFDRTAERYAERAAAKDWRGLVKWCRPDPGDRALDVAAGPALLAGELVPLVAEVTAVDPSAALLAHAPAGVRRVVGRAEQLPFPDGAFSLVTCVHGLHHVASPARALAEMARVLAPGGRLVLEDFVADDDPRIASRWEEIERLRDPGHGRFLHAGEARTRLLPELTIEAEEIWLEPLAVEPWLAVAGCEGDDAARVRALIGPDPVQLRSWRARFVRP
jgi:SAM-dependent methyltransferase